MERIFEDFDEKIFYGLISNAYLKEAITYINDYLYKISNLNDKTILDDNRIRKLIKIKNKYDRVFIRNKYYINKNTIKKSLLNDCIKSESIINLLQIYSRYYHNTFYCKESDSEERLFIELKEYIHYEFNCTSSLICIEECEKILETYFEKLGFCFISGKVNGYYGPYIFKIKYEKVINVDLVENKYDLNVFVIENVISKGWVDYLTLGKLKLNYIIGNNNNIFILNSFISYNELNLYKNKCMSLFRYISEGLYTQYKYKFISVKDVEYRSLLCKLIYSKTFNTFKEVLDLACNDPFNDMKYASYKIINNLSVLLLNKQYEKEYSKWIHINRKLLRNAFKKLYNEHQMLIVNNKNEFINII